MKYPGIRLQIFCKAPIPGQVKTRLHLENNEAVQVHRALAHRTISMALEAELAPIELWCSPDSEHPFFREFDGKLTLRVQEGHDLGERMLKASQSAEAERCRSVIIGTDCPAIDAPYLDDAMTKLLNHDAVLGPAEDGGYGLIGLSRADAAVFENITWSTHRVCAETCSRFNLLKFNWSLLTLIWDVDRPEDLRRWRTTTEND